jgi:hypothetical protein
LPKKKQKTDRHGENISLITDIKRRDREIKQKKHQSDKERDRDKADREKCMSTKLTYSKTNANETYRSMFVER